MPLYEICIAARSIHPVETCALNHHFWKLSPDPITTPIIRRNEAREPTGEITENAAAQRGVESNITVRVAGGENREGNDLMLFSFNLRLAS